MIDFFDWYRNNEARLRGRPWLVVGKGPSYRQVEAIDLSAFNVFALNHAIAGIRADVAHLIDLDVVDACGEQLLAHSGLPIHTFNQALTMLEINGVLQPLGANHWGLT